MLNDLYDLSLKSGQFTIISVAVDGLDTKPRLRGLLDEYDIQYPVLHYLDGEEGGLFDWDIEYLSTDVLIDPQGVIVAEIWVQESLPELIGCLEDPAAGVPRIALDQTKHVNADGSVTANVIVSSSTHEPVTVSYGGYWDYLDPDQDTEYVGGDDEDEATRLIEFSEFGDYAFTIEYPARHGLEDFYAFVSVRLPGTEELTEGEGLLLVNDFRIYYDEEGQVKEY